MSPQKRTKLAEAKLTEYQKNRFSTRYKMLELQEEIESTKEWITYHEGLQKEDILSVEGKKANLDIIKTLQIKLKKLLKQAQEI